MVMELLILLICVLVLPKGQQLTLKVVLRVKKILIMMVYLEQATTALTQLMLIKLILMAMVLVMHVITVQLLVITIN